MAEWISGTEALARILYRDGAAVGMVDSPEIAAEIVEALNTVDAARRVWERVSVDGRVREWTNVGDPAPESGRERSPACPNCPGPTVPHQHMAITRTEFDRIQDQLSRVDPYDSTKGGVTDG